MIELPPLHRLKTAATLMGVDVWELIDAARANRFWCTRCVKFLPADKFYPNPSRWSGVDNMCIKHRREMLYQHRINRVQAKRWEEGDALN